MHDYFQLVHERPAGGYSWYVGPLSGTPFKRTFEFWGHKARLDPEVIFWWAWLYVAIVMFCHRTGRKEHDGLARDLSSTEVLNLE